MKPFLGLFSHRLACSTSQMVFCLRSSLLKIVFLNKSCIDSEQAVKKAWTWIVCQCLLTLCQSPCDLQLIGGSMLPFYCLDPYSDHQEVVLQYLLGSMLFTC